MARDRTSDWFLAAETGDIVTIRMMIVEGAVDVDVRDDQDRTAFHIASQNKYTDIMTTLLAARQMKYLQSIGFDPFTPMPVPDAGHIANQNHRAAS
jgi:ankyrin repeat protein